MNHVKILNQSFRLILNQTTRYPLGGNKFQQTKKTITKAVANLPGNLLDGNKFQRILPINSVMYTQQNLAFGRLFERKKLAQKLQQICQSAELQTKFESNLIVHTVPEPGDPLDGNKFQRILAINSVTHTKQSLAGRRPFERKKLTQKP